MGSSNPCLKRLAFAVAFWGLAVQVDAHVAPWHKSMYCLNGTVRGNEQNTNDAVNPLYNLTRKNWWMHHVNKCDEFPPAPGDFLELPSRGSFVVELAGNRAFTTFSYNGRLASEFGNGEDIIASNGRSREGCVVEPNIHTKSEQSAAGTAFAISYHSNLADVKPENLVVFTVLYRTPWKRIAEYKVPHLPACPPGGCHCVWGWVPDSCGEPNMYMLPFKCKVVGNTGSRAVAPAVPPTFCDPGRTTCVKGAKQMIFWNQQEGNNVFPRDSRHPIYTTRMGFINGAQSDIFLEEGTATSTYIAPGPSVTPTYKKVSTKDVSNGPRTTSGLSALLLLTICLGIAQFALAL